MSNPAREDIFAALFALVSQGEGMGGLSSVTWTAAAAPAQTFLWTSRRVKLWDDVPSQPALCQAEHDEDVTQVTRMPYRRKMKASWMVYHQAAKDPSAVPASTSNAILDALEAALAPPPWLDAQTLGGMVHHCFIDGKIFKDPGDLDQQALIIVPITILVP